MKITVPNTPGPALLSGTSEDLAWARGLLSYVTRDFAPSTGYTSTRHYLTEPSVPGASVLVPPGLVQVLVDQAPGRVTVEDRRAPVPMPDLGPYLDAPWTLRPDQHEMLTAMLRGPAAQPGRGIGRAPTGWGKGRLACALAHAGGGEWLFLVHRGHLAADIAERWESLTGLQAGHIGDGRWDPATPDRDGHALTCCSLATLVARLGTAPCQDLLTRCRGVVLDECHIAGAEGPRAVLSATSAYYRYGLSGTPLDRSDQRSAIAVAWLGPVVHHVSTQDAIAAGILSMPTVHIVPYVHPDDDRDEGAGWPGLYRDRIAENAERNALVLRMMQSSEGPGFVFVRNRKHGLTLTRMARKAKLNVEFVDGKASLAQRKQACASLARADTSWVVCTKVFSEGVDLPALASIVIAGAGKSTIDTLQQIGRAMRVTGTKNTCTIWDVGDKGHTTLNRHAKLRLAACQREGYTITVLQPDQLAA